MLAEDLVVPRIAGAMPPQSFRCDKQVRAPPLTSALGHAAIQPADPALDPGWSVFYELHSPSAMDRLSIAQVRWPRKLANDFRAESIWDGLRLGPPIGSASPGRAGGA